MKSEPEVLKKVSVSLPEEIGAAEWEVKRPAEVSPAEHEQQWSEAPQLRSNLDLLRRDLNQYALALAEISGVNK